MIIGQWHKLSEFGQILNISALQNEDDNFQEVGDDQI